jgi:hypothetical protein
MRLVAAIACAVMMMCADIAPGHADKRAALVIGNSTYQHAGRLANPASDAAAFANLLKASGFEVVEQRSDVGLVEMRRAIGDFAETARDADVAVVYYAGHGIEVDGVNYLIPTDATLARDFGVEDETISLDRVLRAIDSARRLRLVILDECRENPFAQSMKRSSRAIGRGFARVEPTTPDTLVAFAAKAGSIASDGNGANSPFTAALLKHIATPGLDVRLALGRVRDEVMETTRPRQEPFVYGSLGGRTVSIVDAPAGSVNGPISARPVAGEAERVWFGGVKDTTSITVLDDFVRRYPDTIFGTMARERLEALKKSQTTTVTPAQAGALRFRYEYTSGPYVRKVTGTVKDARGLINALARLEPPPGAHGGYGLMGDDSLLGKEPGYGLRQLGLVARQYITFDTLYVEQPPGFSQIGVDSGTFTNADQLNGTTLGWAFFDLRPQFEADLKKFSP